VPAIWVQACEQLIIVECQNTLYATITTAYNLVKNSQDQRTMPTNFTHFLEANKVHLALEESNAFI
jgi:hypothetical protein